MSLLLDALKKAAEQKARKSKEEAPTERASDETLFDAHAAEEIPGLGDDDSRPVERRVDETGLEHAEARAPGQRVERVSGDDTGLDFTDLTDSTDSRQPAPPPGDETGIEVPDATRANVGREYPEREAGDDTGLDIPDATQARLEPRQADRPRSADDTGLDIPEATQTRLEPQQAGRPQADETGLDITSSRQALPGGEDETIVFGSDDLSDFTVDRELDSRRPVERDDQTDLNHTGGAAAIADDRSIDADELPLQPVPEQSQDSEVEPTDDSQPARADDQTDISVPVTVADQVEAGVPAADEDLSLLLVEADDTGRSDDTTYTDPRAVADRLRAQAKEDSSGAELGLVDPTTQTRIQQDQTDTQGATITNSTATKLYADDTTRDGRLAAPTRSTITRPDTTSTHTYAPDNYDRTLMKLPSEDASRLFAGMKSDADVVMTPDHAKRIFRSKTSAQRIQYYKVYGAVAIALLLAVALLGGYKYQEGSEQIDASLMPLKRDPMPGQIKLKQQQETALFSGTDGQVDARTIEIVQSATAETAEAEATTAEPAAAEASAATTQAGTALDQAEASVAAVDSAPVEPESTAAQTEVAMVETAAPSMPAPEPKAVPASPQDAVAKTGADSLPAAPDATSSLQIQVSSQYRQADIWLREAYAAYQAGDLQLALTRYNQVLEIDPGNRNALLGRAAINVQQGRADVAIEDYQTLLLANPKDSLAMSSLLGVASYSPLETESQLKLMIRDEPDSPYLNFALANAYGAQGRWHDAQRHYFTALQNNPEDPNYAYNLAVSLEHISQPGSARVYYQRALDNIQNGLATFSPEVVSQRLQVLGKL